MPKFGRKSKALLKSLHPDLRNVLNEAILKHDFSVICTVRSKEDQDKAFKDGFSKLKWPFGKHNIKNEDEYSLAVDIVPYPAPKNSEEWVSPEFAYQFCYLAGRIMTVADYMGIPVRWGGDWNGDTKFNESFIDMGHFELNYTENKNGND